MFTAPTLYPSLFRPSAAEVLDRVKAEATASAKEAMLTDAPLLMHPGEIALACLVEALSGALPEGRVGEYLASVAVQAAERQQERAEALGHMWRSGAEFRTDGAGGGEKSRSGAAQCEDAANHAGRTCSGDAEELTKRISWGRDIISQGVEQLRRDRVSERRQRYFVLPPSGTRRAVIQRCSHQGLLRCVPTRRYGQLGCGDHLDAFFSTAQEEHRMRELAEKARVSRNPAGDPRSLIFKKRKEEAKDGGKHKGKGKKRKASEEAAFGDD